MKTITAKELRDNLDDVVKRVRQGESLRVTYRSQPAFLLQPDQPKGHQPEPGSQEAMKEFVEKVKKLNTNPRMSSLDPDVPIKDLYHKLLDTDPKYQPHE